jgi:hypothetical protein
MLEKKRQDQTRNREEFPINEESEHHSAESQGRSIHLQKALDVPFLIQLIDPLGKAAFALPGEFLDSPAGSVVNLLVYLISRIDLHSVQMVHNRGSQQTSRATACPAVSSFRYLAMNRDD